MAVSGAFKARVRVVKHKFATTYGRQITTYEIAKLTKSAHEKSFTIANIVGRFRKKGIISLSKDVFTEDVFFYSLAVADNQPGLSGHQGI